MAAATHRDLYHQKNAKFQLQSVHILFLCGVKRKIEVKMCRMKIKFLHFNMKKKNFSKNKIEYLYR